MTDAKTIATYNASAADYANRFSRTEPDQDLRRFIDAIPKGGLVLDWGCGPGNSAAMIQAAGLKAEAVDASEKMVGLAQEKYRLNAKVACFADLDAVDCYDGIWANFSLLHAPRSDMGRHLKAARKALKKGGVLHIGLKLGVGEKRDALERKYTYYQEDALKTLLQDAGFHITFTRKATMKGMTGIDEPFIIINADA